MSYFKGKTVIVTGASSGIGEATAKEFLLQGAKVILVARSESKMNDSFKDFNQDSYSIYPFDLTNLNDIDTFVKMLIKKKVRLIFCLIMLVLVSLDISRKVIYQF